jgi:outer membrane protein OmpA-like peptidoglycan-associated protein/tetratricopeptide (TPR) repeat protein
MLLNKNIVFIHFLLFATCYFSQTKLDDRYNSMGYATVLKGYERDLEKQPTNNTLRHKLAIAYFKVGELYNSYLLYKELVLTDYVDFEPEDWNNYGQLCMSFGQVIEAIKAFDHINQLMTTKKPIDKTHFSVFNLDNVNTQYDEFSPVIVDNQLVFVSDRPASPYDLNTADWSGTSYLSIFSTDLNKLNTTRLFAGKLNESYHNGPISFSPDGNTAFLTRTFKEEKTGLNQSQLYIATKEKNNWKTLVPIDILADKKYSYAHPVFLSDLNMLVFSSNIPGGFGQMDLYYCTYENNRWNEPVNFGKNINTPFNDVFPCYNPYMPNSLYFSSNGYIGFGGLDIYKIQYNDGKWNSPTLLPQSINSNFDDFGICFTSENTGYVSSNRSGGKGRDDIYAFEPQQLVTIEGVLVDAKYHKPLLNKKLYLVNDALIVFDSVITDSKGYFIYTKMPFQNVGLMPIDEEGMEMIIRPLNDELPRDPFTNIQLLSSRKAVLDSIALIQSQLITYVLESADAMKRRCVVYENGDQAVLIAFDIKDENGKTIDRITSDKNGCFMIKKMYPEKSYLDLIDELKSELQMRFVNSKNEKNTNWQKENDEIEITSLKRCVVYENGDKAIQINFAVKDSTGAVIDLITTDDKGCFQLRKLYHQTTYLDLMEDELVEMGLKIVSTDDENQFGWYKTENEIVLKSATLCLAYLDGSPAKNMNFEVKNATGKILSGVNTDSKGCFQIRKMYADQTYFELIDEKYAILRSKNVEEAKEGVLSVEYVQPNGDATLIAQIFDYRNLQKDFSNLKVFFYDENGMIIKVAQVSKNGEFNYDKLSSSKTILMALKDEDGVLQGLDKVGVKGTISPVKKFVQVNNMTIYVLNDQGERFIASKLKSSGKFEFDIALEHSTLVVKSEPEKTFESITTAKKNDVVLKNLYFESGKWDITKEMSALLDELIAVMKKNPNLTVHIKAHTDSRGHSADNMELSNNRANAVSVYLLSKGVSTKQFTTKGYGESRLINHCVNKINCTEQEHAQNRRIEFEFVWK